MASSEDFDFEPFVRGSTAGGGKRVPAPPVTRSALGEGLLASPTVGSGATIQASGLPSLRKPSLPISPDIPSIPNLDSDTDSLHTSPAPAPGSKLISKPRPMARMTPYGGATNVQKHGKKGGGGGVLSVFTGSLGSNKRRASSGSASASTYRPSMLSKSVVGLGVGGGGGGGGPRGVNVPAMAKRRSKSAPPKGLPTISKPGSGLVGLQEDMGGTDEHTSSTLAIPAVLEMIRSVSANAEAAATIAAGTGGGSGVGFAVGEVNVGRVDMSALVGGAVGEGYDMTLGFAAFSVQRGGISEASGEEGDESFVVVEDEGEYEMGGGGFGGGGGEMGVGGVLDGLPLSTSSGSDSVEVMRMERSASNWPSKDKSPTMPSVIDSQPAVPYSSESRGADAVGGGESVVSSGKQRKQSKLEKEEAHTTLKSLSRILKDECKMSKHTLKMALQELEGLHRVHKESMKQEANAITGHSKIKSEYTKTLSGVEGVRRELKGMERKLETADIELKQADETLEHHKERVREAMGAVNRKKEEVGALRALHSVEERDRASKLDELKKNGSGFKSKEGKQDERKAGGKGEGEGRKGAGKKEGKVDEEKEHRKRPSKLGMIGLAPL